MFSIIVYRTIADRTEDIQHAKTHLLHVAQKVSAEQKRVIAFGDSYLLQLMRIPAIRALATEFQDWNGVPHQGCSRLLAGRLKEEPIFRGMALVALSGDVICSALESAHRLNVGDHAYFQKARESSGVVISDVILGRVSNAERLIVLARALRNQQEAVQAVVTVSLDLGWLSKQLGVAELQEGAHLGLFDSNGLIVARYPVEEDWVGRDISDSQLFKTSNAVKRDGTAEMLGLDGTQRIVALTPFSDTVGGQITLWISVPKHSITAHVDRDFAWSLMLSALLLLLAFSTIWLTEDRLILRPVSALLTAARRLAGGDTNSRTGVRHDSSEFGQLANAFDDMAEAIKGKEGQLLKVNRALRVLSAGNRALLHATDERSLLDRICRVVVEVGGYRMAWVGYAQDDAEKSVSIVATFEVPSEFLEAFRVNWGDKPHGQGPTGEAIRRGSAVAVQNILSDPSTALWRPLAVRFQYAAVLAIPLWVENRVIGALTIHAADADAFGDEERVLLGESAADLSFGIGVQRARAREATLQQSLRHAKDRFHAAAEAHLDALLILMSVMDRSGNPIDFTIAEINISAEKLLSLSRKKIIGSRLSQILPYSSSEGFLNKYTRVLLEGEPLEEEFFCDVPPMAGKWWRQQVVRAGDGIAISLRDISAWKATSQKLRENEELLRVAMSAVRMGAWSRDVKSNAYKMTDEMGQLFGLQPGESPRTAEELQSVIHPSDREEAMRIISRPLSVGGAFTFEPRTIWPDGTVHWLHLRGVVANDTAGNPVREVGIAVDITERKANERALARAMRALRTLSAGNEELVRAINEEELLGAVCRVIVEKGGYRLAGVGYAQNDPQRTITPVAWAGYEEDYYGQKRCTWADTQEGQMPISRAIRGGKPVVVHSIETDTDFGSWRQEAIKRGFASNLAVPLCDGMRPFGGLSIYSGDADAFDQEEIRLLTELGNNLAYGIIARRTKTEHDRIAYEHAHHERLLRTGLEESIRAIADTIDMRDPYTAGHQRRVASLAVAIAQEMGLSENEIEGIRLAASVHDLGKLKIPAELLSKPGKLSEIEFMLIQTHAQAGYDILKDITFPWPIATIVWQHHERLDGSGYPRRLKGDDILLESKIMAVADVVEAIASHRPYRPSLGIEVALAEIERGRGTLYDARVTDACLRLFREKRVHFAVAPFGTAS